MTRTAIRLLLGLSLVPILPSVYFVSYFGWDRSKLVSGELGNALSLLSAEILAIGLWILIWRTKVRWTANVTVGTFTLAMLFLMTVGVPYFSSSSSMIESTVYSSPGWMWGVWIIGTSWLWRERPGVMAEGQIDGEAGSEIGPQCPACAYSLRGLAEARCPECGWTGTLDAVIDASLGLGDV